MNSIYFSAARLLVGGYSFYTGVQRLRNLKKNESKIWPIAQLALASWILGREVFAQGGLANRITKFFEPSEIDPTVCDLDQLNTILENRGPKSEIHHLFQSLKERGQLTCDNFLPSKDFFKAKSTTYTYRTYLQEQSPYIYSTDLQEQFNEKAIGQDIDGILPEDVMPSTMWGVDKWKRPFVVFK